MNNQTNQTATAPTTAEKINEAASAIWRSLGWQRMRLF